MEMLALLRPFFPDSWNRLPTDVGGVVIASNLANNAAIALSNCGDDKSALLAYETSIRIKLSEEDWRNSAAVLRNISVSVNRLDQAIRMSRYALELSTLIEDEEAVFVSRLSLFADQTTLGQWEEAAQTWELLDPMGRAWSRAAYAPGYAEQLFAEFHFYQGTLDERYLIAAEQLALEGNNRATLRRLHRLRGDWRLEQGEWALAAASYQEAIRLARERGILDSPSETFLALAKHHLGQLINSHDEAERLTQADRFSNHRLAQLWLALGDTTKAKHHALTAYKLAWADGGPYVYSYGLIKATELLQQLNVPIPSLPPYDPAKDEHFPWEDDVHAAIEKLRAKKEAEKASEKKTASED